MHDAQHTQAIRELLTLPPMATHGRARLVDTAMSLFYYQGINPVGLDEVLAEAGVSKTTFYKHFGSKTELVVAAVEARDTWQMSAWKQAVQLLAGDDPRAQLLAIFDVLDLALNEPTFLGCQFINAAAEFPNLNDPVHRAAARHKRTNQRWIHELAVAAGASDAESFADAFTMLFEGALVLRQAHDRDDAARAARPHVLRLLAAYIPHRIEPESA